MIENVIAPLLMALAVPAGIVLAGQAVGMPLELAALAPLAWATASLAVALMLGRQGRGRRGARRSETSVPARDDFRSAA